MAGEFQQQPFPENVPITVLNGYQRQNIYLGMLETGLDTTNPFDDGAGTITVPAGGQVEYNGVLFKLTADIVLAKPDPNISYWLKVVDNGDGTASFELVTRPGVWDNMKQGFYIINGTESYRTLNWVSRGDISNLVEQFIFHADETGNVISVHDVNIHKSWVYREYVGGIGVDYSTSDLFIFDGVLPIHLGKNGSVDIYALGN